MSSRTPDECVERALDESATEGEREDAIHELKLANECDELEALVRTEDLGDRYRQRALRAIATPQCDSTLRELVEGGDLERSLREEAESLLDGIADGDEMGT